MPIEMLSISKHKLERLCYVQEMTIQWVCSFIYVFFTFRSTEENFI